MAGTAIQQFGALDRIVFGFGFVAINTPAHVHGLFYRGNSFCAHIAMASLRMPVSAHQDDSTDREFVN